MYNIPSILDNSMRKEFEICPTRFFYTHVACWSRVDKPKTAANFGSALHEALATYYTQQLEERDFNFDEIYNAFETYFDEHIEPNDFYTKDRGLSVLQNYINEYQHEKEKIIHVESAFALELYEPFVYTGKIDMVLERKDHLLIRDHKTTKSFSQNTLGQIYPNAQLTGYCWAMRNYTTKPIYCELNFIIFRAKNTEFQRTMPHQYTNADIENWRRSTLWTMRQILQCSQENFFPMNTNNCYAFFGECPYVPLCMSTRNCIDIYNFGMPALYEKQIWEPFEGARGNKNGN